MFEQAFKRIDNLLRKEAGCATELDYTEQTSWLLFLKYLDDLERERADKAELEGKNYEFLIDEPYRWSTWAVPKNEDGSVDHNRGLTGEDLLDFVNGRLFPYFKGFRERAAGADTTEYKIAEIFSEVRNRFSSGYSLREVLEVVDRLRFGSQERKHELSQIYEEKIRNMGNAGRNGGEYYTPRPLVRAMVKVVAPKVGETVYDGACGSAGFLCEAHDYMKAGRLTTGKLEILQNRTFYGKEKKALAYIIAIMNMILHGIDTPNIVRTNTLAEKNLADIEEKDRYDVILANPPFGGNERKEVRRNFPIQTGETALLFLQHFIKSLKAGGKAAVVIKSTFLSGMDNASKSLRRELLKQCNLHTVLDCPQGVFPGAGVKTVVLFFVKGKATKKIWYYELDPGRRLGKTEPLNDNDLAEFVALQKKFADSKKSWTVNIKDVDDDTFDLSVRNPNTPKETPLRPPDKICEEIEKFDREAGEILSSVRKDLFRSYADGFREGNGSWPMVELGEVCEFNPKKSEVKNLLGGSTVSFVPMADLNQCQMFLIPKQERLIKEVYGGYTYFAENDVLLARVTPCFENGKSGIAKNLKNSIGFGSSEFFVYRPSKDVLPEWIYLFISSKEFIGKGKSNMGGTSGLQRLTKDYATNYKIPLPPLSEQKRIVAFLGKTLGTIPKVIANTEKNIENAKELFDSYVESRWHGKGWPMVELGEVVTDMKDGGTPSRKNPEYFGGEINWAVVKDIKPEIWHTSERLTELGLQNSSAKVWEADSIIISLGASIGNVGIAKKPTATKQGLCGIVVDKSKVIPEFLAQALRSRKSFIQSLASGVTIKEVRPSKLKSAFTFPLPPLPVQKRIVSELNTFAEKAKKLEETYRLKVASLKNLKQSVMQKVLQGKSVAGYV